MRFFVRAALAGLTLGLSHASADVLSFQAARDNTLFESATGALSNGAGPNIFTGRNSQGNIRRALLRFDLAAIPAGSTITGVSLTLVASQTQGPATDVGLHPLLADWGEGASSSSGGGGAPAQPGDATWIHSFFPTSLWAAPGGDFAASPSGVQSVFEPGTYIWESTASLVEDVQSWLETPGANFGWAIMGREDVNGTAKRFESREAAEMGNRPVLRVEYVVPSPSGGALAGFGVWYLGRRRR